MFKKTYINKFGSTDNAFLRSHWCVLSQAPVTVLTLYHFNIIYCITLASINYNFIIYLSYLCIINTSGLKMLNRLMK
jgi:hypothetical protein